MQAAGLGLLARQAPVARIGPAEEEALHCWRFCAGYEPSVWPLYVSLHEVPDPMALMELQAVIRDAIRERDVARVEEERVRVRR